jgi:CPA1 family monovalent cation:H+ antiporter
MTLRPLIAWLGVEDDGTVEREVRLARVETLRAALDAAAKIAAGEAVELLRRRYELRLRHAEGDGSAGDPNDTEVVRVATAAERKRLIELREKGTIGDAAFQRVEQELDLRELDLLSIAGA